MPRTDRALRRCYLKRMVIEGNIELEARRATEPDIYSFSPREHNKGILPVNPYVRERSRGRSLTPPGRRRKPPVIAIPNKSSRRIRWSEDGDTIRMYSPYRDDSPEVLLSPRYIQDLPKEPDKHAPIHRKAVKKKKKKKTTKESQLSSIEVLEEEQRRRELEERKRKEQETRMRELERQKEKERRNAQQRIIEEKDRKDRIKQLQEERWRKELQETRKKSKKSTIKRSQSTGNLRPKVYSTKISHKVKNKQLKAITPLHPRWNYVGDPTRKAYNTQQASYLSDFHF